MQIDKGDSTCANEAPEMVYTYSLKIMYVMFEPFLLIHGIYYLSTSTERQMQLVLIFFFFLDFASMFMSL